MGVTIKFHLRKSLLQLNEVKYSLRSGSKEGKEAKRELGREGVGARSGRGGGKERRRESLQRNPYFSRWSSACQSNIFIVRLSSIA